MFRDGIFEVHSDKEFLPQNYVRKCLLTFPSTDTDLLYDEAVRAIFSHLNIPVSDPRLNTISQKEKRQTTLSIGVLIQMEKTNWF